MRRECQATIHYSPSTGSSLVRRSAVFGLYPAENRFDREEALKLYTLGSSWFSTEDGKEGGARAGTTGGLRRALSGLLLHPGRGDQATRIGPDDSWWEGRSRNLRILKTRATSPTREPRLVSCQKLRRVCRRVRPSDLSARPIAAACSQAAGKSQSERAGTCRCWVSLGYGSWVAIASRFDLPRLLRLDVCSCSSAVGTCVAPGGIEE